MGNYTIFLKFENPRRGRQARNFTTNIPKILDLKSSSEQLFSENWRWVPLSASGLQVATGATKRLSMKNFILFLHRCNSLFSLIWLDGKKYG